MQLHTAARRATYIPCCFRGITFCALSTVKETWEQQISLLILTSEFFQPTNFTALKTS